MADFSDVATQISEEQLQQSLTNRAQFTAHSYYECEDCGVEIPEQRRKIGGVTRCTECQTCFEAQSRNFRG